jgi:hypothetical protein
MLMRKQAMPRLATFTATLKRLSARSTISSGLPEGTSHTAAENMVSTIDGNGPNQMAHATTKA